MKTFKIICLDEKNNHKYVDAEIKKSFGHFGHIWCVHRPHGLNKTWIVSEYNTGMKCSAPENTIEAAEREAKKKLDAIGQERTDRALKLALEQRGVINESL